jgi:hypothetical protein
MGVGALRRGVVVVGAMSTLLASGTAHAVNGEHVEWTGYGWSNCTVGTSIGWTCTYDIYSESCPEVAVVGITVASCDLITHVVVPIYPVLNAVGRLVGCTSRGPVLLNGSYVYFDSTVPVFDNQRIDQLVIGSISDVFADGKPAALSFTAYEAGQSDDVVSFWVVNGGFAGTCQRGAYYAANSGAGTVDVQV